ncbi:MAG TPA: iron-sulfur cluster repair di-iron protein [Vicinamibacterales bacterium]|nr:iron-sulfur cluster repair di-iron protein [Vicinamibacterales bacterium]
MTATPDMTIRELVAGDFRTAAVFERHGVDFCCHACQTLAEGCEEAGVDAGPLLQELEAILESPADAATRFNEWPLPSLVDHIVTRHHAYVRESLPRLLSHSRKIADVHGSRHPELARVAKLVEEVNDEMTSHMMKEEHILFPYISNLARAAEGAGSRPMAPFGTVQNPIRMMEAEHESAGRAMAEMRSLTNGFRPPADACGTYQVCLQELEAFEQDLHAHVHLENNILFPKAARIEAALD